MHRNVLSIGKCIEKIYTSNCKKIADKHGVSTMEVAILNFLYNNPDTDTAKDFASFAHISKSCISEAIESLTRRGFLIGNQDATDRRYIHLEIQEAAESLVKDSLVMQQEFINTVLRGFDENEVKLLDELLDRVAENIKNASNNI